ncbi:site-2 protease family protein [Asticcacaulis sp. 201]|uniref:site-2 protease family protein n=1 Tax=Asticcacaulis sp. 201 TaxID=3028787 RepID=UPI0029164C34|nr:site-2 protease family protein [Asticcacaulis sp. 201]MDV6330170.1 site-2 protease family protein [Asticcacaulis sp. 201]
MKTDISWNFLGLFAAFIAAGAALVFLPTGAGVATFAFVLLGWIVSVCLHEYAHAATASAFGDVSILDRGYLTLDPVKYINSTGSLVLPVIALVLGGIALPGAAVTIRTDLIRHRWQQSLVSLARPVTTAVLAVVVYLASQGAADPLLHDALMLLAFFELMACVLNLLPVPGLDGFGVIEPFLPRAVRQFLSGKRLAVLNLILLALVFFLGYRIIMPIMRLVITPFDIDLTPVGRAFDRFHFWRQQ